MISVTKLTIGKYSSNFLIESLSLSFPYSKENYLNGTNNLMILFLTVSVSTSKYARISGLNILPIQLFISILLKLPYQHSY